MDSSCAALQAALEHGEPVYGITTGFGPLVRFDTSNNDAQGIGLIRHLCAGSGSALPQAVVRSAMLLRLHTVIQGHSGISCEAAERYRELLNDVLQGGTTPFVPAVGSLGASGDLIPLAHVLQSLPETHQHTLSGRDALALVNGTSFSTAFAALSLVRAERMIACLEDLTAWILGLWQCRQSSLSPRLHAAKGHWGQEESARRIAAEVRKYGLGEDDTRPLQEIYSLRCAPQILGAVRDVMRSAREMIQQEMNGIDDNPFIDAMPLEARNDELFRDLTVLHGGNFMTQHIAFAADMLNNALTQAGNLAERHIFALTNPETSHAPLLLAFRPGHSSGMAGVQLTATALVAEMRANARNYGSSTLPTNAGNQDIVPMGFQAAQTLFAQTERLAGILACELLCCSQLAFLIQEGSARGRYVPPPEGLKEATNGFVPVRDDRALYGEIAALAEWFLGEGIAK